jgi:phage-related protein
MTGTTRSIRRVNAARRSFEDFPPGTREDLLDALIVVAEGGYPSIAKPLSGLGSGIMELASRHRGDAFRVVYTLQVGLNIWVVHAFQKKSKTGIATPRRDIALVRERIKRLTETFR